MEKLEINIGEKYGNLTVSSEAFVLTTPSGYKVRTVNCVCDCGNTTNVGVSALKNGKIKTCGCSKKRNVRKYDRFGRLVIIKEAPRYSRYVRMFECLCDCGKTTVVALNSLASGSTTSCGCYAKEVTTSVSTKHGLSTHKLYNKLYSIRHRCYSPNDPYYSIYGGRGIKVCDEWINDFKVFYDWAMSSGYKEGLTIDRIDVNGDYKPSNCRWVTLEVQNNNKRNNRYISIDGETKTMTQWSKIHGISPVVVSYRLAKKWPIKKALTTPVKERKKPQ